MPKNFRKLPSLCNSPYSMNENFDFPIACSFQLRLKFSICQHHGKFFSPSGYFPLFLTLAEHFSWRLRPKLVFHFSFSYFVRCLLF